MAKMTVNLSETDHFKAIMVRYVVWNVCHHLRVRLPTIMHDTPSQDMPVYSLRATAPLSTASPDRQKSPCHAIQGREVRQPRWGSSLASTPISSNIDRRAFHISKLLPIYLPPSNLFLPMDIGHTSRMLHRLQGRHNYIFWGHFDEATRILTSRHLTRE